MLTKIGDGKALDSAEQALIETRIRDEHWCLQHVPEAVRLFQHNFQVDSYNRTFETPWHSVAYDDYIGCRSVEQLSSARNRVHRMKGSETVHMLYDLPLAMNEPYMITVNINVSDGIVNGAIGILRHIDFRSQETTNDPSLPGTSSANVTVPFCC